MNICYLHSRESDAYKEVGEPVDEDSYGHGRGTRALGEELSRDEPGDWAGAESEEDDKHKRRHDRQVRHPVDHFLDITKELLSGVVPPSDLLESPQSSLHLAHSQIIKPNQNPTQDRGLRGCRSEARGAEEVLYKESGKREKKQPK